MFSLLRKIIPTKNERELKKIQPIVEQINSLESNLRALTDDQLRAKTPEFKERISRGESLDALLPETFAVVREVARRTLNMRHFDVQLIGGVVLHQGKIAEMKTGEGKTLVATLAVYLNALLGKGAHVITVNDYLARRDAEWMGAIYKFLGMSVGVIVHGLTDTERKWAYQADITYGTNNEFGFDFLRDNMKYSLEAYVQRPLHYAIVDEVDSILIDEARTPLIISGPAEESTDKYYKIDTVIPRLTKGAVIEDKKAGTKQSTGDYTVDEKSRSVVLTEAGVAKVERILGVGNLYDPENIETLHHVNQGLRAHALYKRDVDYVVKEDQVIIVDEFTGRLMPGRRWSDGLHQAVEAKEKVRIENENQTLATITFQNFFRMYQKLAGMTGTADTEAPEFAKIYNLEVMVIPTHLPMIREDLPDVIYRTEREKFSQVGKDIQERHERGQPVLVGTISIEKSEILSQLLKREGITHHVLNAKHHEREAEIIAQAGRLGAVTISTNMAGRGTDIILGGNPEFLAKSQVDREQDPAGFERVLAECRKLQVEEREKVLTRGGLHILGTERHESRRIDNQLRGRAGRQGDPGSSQFYLCLEDDLLRIFGSERISGLMGRLGMEENEPITHPWITRAIENAQKKVEAHNFEIRKHLLEYDDVMNQQRKTVYGMRRAYLEGSGIEGKVLDLIDQEVTSLVASLPEKPERGEDLDLAPMEERLRKLFDWEADWKSLGIETWTQEAVGQRLYGFLEKLYRDRESLYTPPVFREASKLILLSTLDALWKDHLLSMDHLREGIGLRGYGQRDPLLEYKREGFQLFQGLIQEFREDVLGRLFHVRISGERQVAQLQARPRSPTQLTLGRGAAPVATPPSASPTPNPAFARASQPPPKAEPVHVVKVGRNDPCPCGAKKPDGAPKKYKHCHGREG